MHKTGLTLATVGALAVCLSACASNSPSSAGSAYGAASPTASSGAGTMASQPKTTMLTIRKTKIGYVLTNAGGYTLYWYSKDVKGGGTSACTGQCLITWPAVTGKPAVASGIKLNGILGTITRPGGIVQATYNGYPLYTYVGDFGPGDIAGNGLGGVWHVITGDVLTSSVPSGTGGSSGSVGSGESSTPTPTHSASPKPTHSTPPAPSPTPTGNGGGYGY